MIAGIGPLVRHPEHLSVLQTTNFRSTDMYTMHEALARDRMREVERQARDAQQARSASVQRRRHRVSLHALTSHARHPRRSVR